LGAGTEKGAHRRKALWGWKGANIHFIFILSCPILDYHFIFIDFHRFALLGNEGRKREDQMQVRNWRRRLVRGWKWFVLFLFYFYVIFMTLIGLI